MISASSSANCLSLPAISTNGRSIQRRGPHGLDHAVDLGRAPAERLHLGRSRGRRDAIENFHGFAILALGQGGLGRLDRLRADASGNIHGLRVVGLEIDQPRPLFEQVGGEPRGGRELGSQSGDLAQFGFQFCQEDLGVPGP